MSPALHADGKRFEIREETWAAWKALAVPFVDSPDDVLVRLFAESAGMASAGTADEPVATTPAASGRGRRTDRARRSSAPARTRAASHEILPEPEYFMPILRAIAEAGGSLEASAVVDSVGLALADRLTEVDRGELPKGGGTRWRNRVQFARLRLVRRGFLRKDSPRGVWEISSEGRRFLREGNQ